MENFLAELAVVAGVHLLAVMSPGPDFAMIVRNSLKYSRRTGVYTAIGLGLGILVHVTYSLVGIGFLIAQSVILFNIVKIAGALYLIYIGIRSLQAKPVVESVEETEKNLDISKWEAIKIGFLTNVLNPKATLFFLSLFSLVISPETTGIVKVIYGIEMSVATALWFAFVAVLLSHSVIKKKFRSIQHYFERTMGAVLVALGIKIISSK